MYRLLVTSVKEYAVYLLDSDGAVLHWNVGAKGAKGYTADEIVGRNYECFYSSEDCAKGIPRLYPELTRQNGHLVFEEWRDPSSSPFYATSTKPASHLWLGRRFWRWRSRSRLTTCIEAVDTKIVAAVKGDDTARRLTRIPGVGPIIAATVRATSQDPGAFPTGRDLADWIGIPASPFQRRQGTARQDIEGEQQAVAHLADRRSDFDPEAGPSRGEAAGLVVSLLARRPYEVAAVALANKMARTIWALLVKGGVYQAPPIMARV